MLKFVSKFALDILPSVVATIIGAYIVNHYIVARPGANAPVAAAVSTTEPKAEAKVAPEAATADAKASETSSGAANIPEPGVKAKGISEKAIIEKTATEKPAEKSADKPAETASIPVDTRRHPREKAVAKAAPVPVQPSAPAVVPVVAAPTTAPPVEAAIAPEEHRDANELARAAIERLRGAGEGSSRSQEAARTPDAPRVPDAARVPDPSRVVSAPPVRPLPPPIMVSTPGPETFDSTSGSSQIKPPYTGAVRIDDPRRPTPPADIPAAASRPLDLRAEVAEPPARDHTSVAEDMLSAAKSVFHAVLPK
jgi:hypothetical protein